MSTEQIAAWDQREAAARVGNRLGLVSTVAGRPATELRGTDKCKDSRP